MMFPLYIVLDTNILVSALWKNPSVASRLVEAVDSGLLVPVVSDGILDEYHEVLSRSKFRFAPTRYLSLIQLILQRAERVVPPATAVPMPDADDAVFYATALASRAAGNVTYLVTGNLRHVPQEEFIVSPRTMLDIIGQLHTAAGQKEHQP